MANARAFSQNDMFQKQQGKTQCIPVVSGTQKAEAGRSFDPRRYGQPEQRGKTLSQ